MSHIRIGYIKGKINSHIYRKQLEFLKKMKVDKVYHDKDNGNIELSAMVDYIREGDIVFIYSLSNMGNTIKSVINIIMQIVNKNVELLINQEGIYTSDKKGKYAVEILSALYNIGRKHDITEREECNSEKGRLPRELEDLKYYMKQVERKNMTVQEVCRRLSIGRTTYYRRIKELKNKENE